MLAKKFDSMAKLAVEQIFQGLASRQQTNEPNSTEKEDTEIMLETNNEKELSGKKEKHKNEKEKEKKKKKKDKKKKKKGGGSKRKSKSIGQQKDTLAELFASATNQQVLLDA